MKAIVGLCALLVVAVCVANAQNVPCCSPDQWETFTVSWDPCTSARPTKRPVRWCQRGPGG